MIKFTAHLLCAGGVRDHVRCQEVLASNSHPTAEAALGELTEEARYRGWQLHGNHLCPLCVASARAKHSNHHHHHH